MVSQWDRSKPEGINDKTWRRKQIEMYIRNHSDTPTRQRASSQGDLFFTQGLHWYWIDQ